MKNLLKRALIFMLVFSMVIPMPLEVLAKPLEPRIQPQPAEPVKLEDGQKAEDLVKNPEQPELYTLYTDYKVERKKKGQTDSSYEVNYQPYVATVGEDAKEAEKAKVDRDVKVPDFEGYEDPKGPYDPLDPGSPFKIDPEKKTFHITYDTIKEAAKKGNKTGDDEFGWTFKKDQEYRYDGKPQTIKIRHIFQDFDDFNKYGNKPGETEEIVTEQKAKTGSWMEVEPLPEDQREGYVPDNDKLGIYIPEVVNNIVIEYRYNRAHCNVIFDTVDGTPLPSRTYYYKQLIPGLKDSELPTKEGSDFIGWKPSVDLKSKEGKTFPAGQLIKDDQGNPIKNLEASLIMPDKNVIFTAVWKDLPYGDYIIQFWAEKADHEEGGDLTGRYDFIGVKEVKKATTGSRPDLSAFGLINQILFPDLDQDRLNKIWQDEAYFNKFYKYNGTLTLKQNADKEDPTVVKGVSSNGKTVYNIYYDRQVYTLYFTGFPQSVLPFEDETYVVPTIKRNGKTIGTPEAPYHFKARFNQNLAAPWPKDPIEVFGLTYGSFGYLPILQRDGETTIEPHPYADPYRDTPPYRLSVDYFLEPIDYPEDFPEDYKYKLPIRTKTEPKEEYELREVGPNELVFGIEQGIGEDNTAVPHHVDVWTDDFEGQSKVNYKFYSYKSDTPNPYPYLPPVLEGFTPKEVKPGETRVEALWVDKKGVDKKNQERQGNNPEGYVPMEFVKDFPGQTNNFKENGYLKFEYSRNKYTLKLNNDWRRIKPDAEYTADEKLEVYYEYPLKDLELDITHRPQKPDWVPKDWVFKGWAVDAAGQNFLRDHDFTMPARNQIVYAKWDEPDYKWKVTYDPNGGTLDPISLDDLTTEKKSILEGDAGEEKVEVYPKKEANDGDKQVFTVVQRQKLKEPAKKPTRKGYSFLGWEVLRYKKDAQGQYTGEVDTSYYDTYKVPELYPFGNEVVGDVYLKAIWVEKESVSVKVYHHFLNQRLDKDESITENPAVEIIENQLPGQYTTAVASRQDGKWILVPHREMWVAPIEPSREIKDLYRAYNKRMPFNNTFYHLLKVEPEKHLVNGKLVDNPAAKNNHFHFFYRPFKTVKYKVNYLDERVKEALQEKKAKGASTAEINATIRQYSLLNQEEIESLCQRYDARNYKPIKGWKLVSDPQQQLFLDVNEETGYFNGINGTSSKEINFYYKDVRVIEVPGEDPPPEGYVRVTFKAEAGGSFGKDKDGNPIKELHYDVIEGLKSELLPVPKEWKGGLKNKDKHYITPDPGRSFVKWDNHPLLAKGTPIEKANEDSYLFTAYFDEASVVPTPEDPDPGTTEVEKPKKLNGYYPFRPYFLTGKNACKMIRDFGEEDVQEMLDAFNTHANWFKENHVPDVDQISEHINMHGYELLAKQYNNEYGTISFHFGTPVTLAEWKNLLNKDKTMKARFADPAEQAIQDLDKNGENRQGIKVNNKTYYVPVYIDYKPKTYKVYWEIVPNKVSIEQTMGYWPGRDINEEYDRLVGGNPFKADLWSIKHIGKADPCNANEVSIPMPDIRTHDKAGLWFYAPALAPKAVKIKDTNPAQYKVTFEFTFAGTETYQKYYRK